MMMLTASSRHLSCCRWCVLIFWVQIGSKIGSFAALTAGGNGSICFSNMSRLRCTNSRQQSADAYSSSVTVLQSSSRGSQPEDLYAAVHRKEYEMKAVRAQHAATTDPVRMAMMYAQESVSPMRLAKALRRVYDDPHNPANAQSTTKTTSFNQKDYSDSIATNPSQQQQQQQHGDTTTSASATAARAQKLQDLGMIELGMRRASFVVDIKRKSLSRPGQVFCHFDDAGMVAEAMVRLGADAVMVNVDYAAYGGDLTELKSAVRAVRRVSATAAVVMKDIVVDEIQLGLAKEAGADGILLIASVLGPALDNFLNLATSMGLETIVECHTRNEVQRALEALATNIMVSNYDRISQMDYPQQAIRLAGMFPGSGGPIICLAGGGLEAVNPMKRHLAVGYDGVVVGRAVMGSPRAPEYIRAVRDRTLLPAEFSQWGLDDGEMEFDMEGNPMPGPKRGIPSPNGSDLNR